MQYKQLVPIISLGSGSKEGDSDFCLRPSLDWNHEELPGKTKASRAVAQPRPCESGADPQHAVNSRFIQQILQVCVKLTGMFTEKKPQSPACGSNPLAACLLEGTFSEMGVLWLQNLAYPCAYRQIFC